MATYDSDQIAKLDLAPTPSALAANELLGRVRIARFSHVIPTGGYAQDDVLELIDLPKGALLLGGAIVFSAMGASRTVLVGTAADTDRYLASTSTATAGTALIGNTIALNFHEVLTVKTRLQAVMGGGTWPAAGVFNGHVLFVTD